ncbi:MAG: hypothetical protein EA369_07995 [Bradymonadales bacterium]|nr:MAG: hypothetical protein EA369_07995 [Bradymonadales bacterium]
MKDPRLREHLKRVSLQDLPASAENAVVILCYPDDEGVRNNSGRPGAAEGPAAILKYLEKACWRSSDSAPQIFVLQDKLKGARVLDRHEEAARWSHVALERGFRVISLGGGHDYGYPDASNYLKFVRDGRVLNCDAHLDVRELDESRVTSGTAFYRLLQEFEGKKLIQWGIQWQCSAQSHLDFCRERGVQIHSWEEACPKIDGPVGLSICLDAVAVIRGVSAPTLVGLSTKAVLDAVREFSERSQWMGLYEVAPSLDPATEDSARFAALLAYHFIFRSGSLKTTLGEVS